MTSMGKNVPKPVVALWQKKKNGSRYKNPFLFPKETCRDRGERQPRLTLCLRQISPQQGTNVGQQVETTVQNGPLCFCLLFGGTEPDYIEADYKRHGNRGDGRFGFLYFLEVRNVHVPRG